MFFLLIVESNVSGRLSFGPELENSALPATGSTNLPLMAPPDLLKSMLLTLSSSTALTNCEYVRSAFDALLPARLLTTNAAAISARTIHGTQRNDGDPPPPDGGVGRRSGGCRSGGGPSLGGPGGRASGRHEGGGVGGRPLGPVGARKGSVSPASGSTPGSRSVWRRLMLRPAPRRRSLHATARRRVRRSGRFSACNRRARSRI